MSKVRECFRWGVENDLVSVGVLETLKAIRPLSLGRSDAKESTPKGPVSDEHVEKTLPYLTPTVAAMVSLQRLTGARPGEICGLRPVDLDSTNEVWEFRPPLHKTSHKGKERVIPIGPKAQAVLIPFLDCSNECYCFSPVESRRQSQERRHAKRKTPPSVGNYVGKSRKENPKRQPTAKFTNASYRKAIVRACKLAGVPAWSPNQLRKTRLTEIRKQVGIEAAQCVAGHSSLSTTEIYAERDRQTASRIALASG